MTNESENQNWILVVEDSDTKWRKINDLLCSFENSSLSIERAATMDKANALVALRSWQLVLLDISMDIRSSSSGPNAGGHDSIGGLKIAERMFYLGYDAPIVIVTAFDAFPANIGEKGTILGLEDVIKQAEGTLGAMLVGWVRYNDPNWAKTLADYVHEVLKI